MKTLFTLTLCLAATAAPAASASAIATRPRAAEARSERSLLRRVEDRQQIEDLLTAYGATLDRGDFAAFGRLFTADAVYAGGAGKPIRGRAAIEAQLERIFAANPSHLPQPAFHLYFDPSIHVDGDRATAQSKGAYLVPDPSNHGWRIVFFVSYDDLLVRRGGHWLFQQRIIRSPAPPAQGR
jgi:uncharacterized protein (TIGR02246 family)